MHVPSHRPLRLLEGPAGARRAGDRLRVVKEPTLPRSRRKEVERLSAQRLLPVIEFEGGDAYRAESVEMASTMRAGKLFDIVGGRSRGDAVVVSGSRRNYVSTYRRRSSAKRPPPLGWQLDHLDEPVGQRRG